MERFLFFLPTQAGPVGTLFGSIGCFHDPSGTFLYIQTPSALFFSTHQNSKYQEKVGNPTPICSDTGASTSRSTGPRIKKVLKIVFPSLFGTQKVEGMETGTRPEVNKTGLSA